VQVESAGTGSRALGHVAFDTVVKAILKYAEIDAV